MVGLFGKAGTEVPLPRCGGQGQVMCARERVGPRGMACALGSPGVQGSSAVTLNQNRHLPFERLEGRRTGGQINTKVGSGVLYGFGGPAELSHTCPQCVYVCVFQSEKAMRLCFCVYHLCSLYFCDLPPSYLFISDSLSLVVLYEQPPLPPVSCSVCLSIHLQLLSEFNLTALWQIQIYDLRNEARLNPRMGRRAPIPPKQPNHPFPHSPCSSPFITIPGVTTGQQLKSFKQPQSMQSHFEGL